MKVELARVDFFYVKQNQMKKLSFLVDQGFKIVFQLDISQIFKCIHSSPLKMRKVYHGVLKFIFSMLRDDLEECLHSRIFVLYEEIVEIILENLIVAKNF